MLQAARLVRVCGLRACSGGTASVLAQRPFGSDADSPHEQGGDPQRQAAQRQGDGGGGGGGGEQGGKAQVPRRQWAQRGPHAAEEGEAAHSSKRIFPAYIYNVSQNLLREDIAAFLDGCGLPADEIRPEFSWARFEVERFWLAFGSAEDRERALRRHGAYLGTRRVLLRRATHRDFSAAVFNPLAMSSRGRYVLVDGLSSSCTSEDVLRLFPGYDIQAKAVTFLRDQQAGERVHKRRRSSSGGSEGQEKAVVRFATPHEAHRALRDRQGSFCGNSRVRLRVLQ